MIEPLAIERRKGPPQSLEVAQHEHRPGRIGLIVVTDLGLGLYDGQEPEQTGIGLPPDRCECRNAAASDVNTLPQTHREEKQRPQSLARQAG